MFTIVVLTVIFGFFLSVFKSLVYKNIVHKKETVEEHKVSNTIYFSVFIFSVGFSLAPLLVVIVLCIMKRIQPNADDNYH